MTIPAQGAAHALSAQAVFSADGSTVYAAVNGQNRVVAMNARPAPSSRAGTSASHRASMALVGGKLYVSNEGGRAGPAR